MMNGSLTFFLLIALAGLLLAACWLDLKERRIPNWLTLTVALLAPLWWFATDVAFFPDVLWRLVSTAIILFILIMAFKYGQMGGGDVKLAGAIALWLAPYDAAKFFIFFSLIGGPVTIAAMLHHRWTKAEGPLEPPYGLAIAAGAALVLGQPFINQFSG